METLHKAFSLIKLKCQHRWDRDLDKERKQMLSLQNLQPNKHDVEDGMSTDVKKKKEKEGGGELILLLLEDCLYLFLSAAPPDIPLSTVLNVLLK